MRKILNWRVVFLMMLFLLLCGAVVSAQQAGVETAEVVEAVDVPEASPPGFWILVFTKGGVVTWLIALLSAVGVPIGVVKIYHFWRMDIWRSRQVRDAVDNYRAGRIKGLGLHFQSMAHPAASLIAFAIAEAHDGQMTPTALREELTRRAQFLLRHLSLHIWVLELIAASAPLFGLLGTVLGMIVAFQGVGQGSGGADTTLLAAGIWEALLTTAFGLGVALPFSMLATVFNNAVDNVRNMVEDTLTDILVRSGRV